MVGIPGYDMLVSSIKTRPETWAVVFIAMAVVLLIIIIQALRSREGFLGVSPLNNLTTGSNWPMWQYQRGDAGWGGSLHSTFQDGETRVWGASAEGGDSSSVVSAPSTSCGKGGCGLADGEMQAVMALNGGGVTASKDMSDDQLSSVLNGGRP